jgi:hypothetical protein
MGLFIGLEQAAHSIDDQMGVGNPFPCLTGGTIRASKTFSKTGLWIRIDLMWIWIQHFFIADPDSGF